MPNCDKSFQKEKIFLETSSLKLKIILDWISTIKSCSIMVCKSNSIFGIISRQSLIKIESLILKKLELLLQWHRKWAAHWYSKCFIIFSLLLSHNKLGDGKILSELIMMLNGLYYTSKRCKNDLSLSSFV